MDLTPGQLTFPFTRDLELLECAAEALLDLHRYLDEHAVDVYVSRRTPAELERLMVLADELVAVLLAP